MFVRVFAVKMFVSESKAVTRPEFRVRQEVPVQLELVVCVDEKQESGGIRRRRAAFDWLIKNRLK